MSIKEITEEQFNSDIPPSRLEESFKELLNEHFVKDIRKYLIHEICNLNYHSGCDSIFNLEHIDHYERVKIERNTMDNPFFITKEASANLLANLPFSFKLDDPATKLDALVIPFMDGYGSACHIKLCISINSFHPAYEVKFQIRGARTWSRVRVRPHTALKVIQTLQYPQRNYSL